MKKLWSVLFLLISGIIFAGDYTLSVKLNPRNGILKCGQQGKITVSLTKGGKPEVGKNIWIGTPGQKAQLLPAGDSPSALVSVDKPGWICQQITVMDSSGNVLKDKDGNDLIRHTGFLCEPEKIQVMGLEPPDFDQFWDKAKKEVEAVPMKNIKTRKLDEYCYDIQIPCAGGRPVSGILVLPKNARAGSCPALVSFHGAGVYSAHRETRFADAGFMVFDVNAHGIANEQPESYYQNLRDGELYNYFTRGMTHPESCYMRGMFQRVLRALEYMQSRPEWNGRDLIVYGGSQGGTQAVVGAALNHNVTLCVACVPGFCDIQRTFTYKNMKHKYFREMLAAIFWPEAKKFVFFFDCAFFAKRVACPVYFTTALDDVICQPSGVYAAWNLIPGKYRKNMYLHLKGGHPGGRVNPDAETILRTIGKK